MRGVAPGGRGRGVEGPSYHCCCSDVAVDAEGPRSLSDSWRSGFWPRRCSGAGPGPAWFCSS